MASRNSQAAPPPPPFWIATADLFIGGHAGTMPARAFCEGDRVPPDLIEPHGWADLVTAPDGYEQPPVDTTDTSAAAEGDASVEADAGEPAGKE